MLQATLEDFRPMAPTPTIEVRQILTLNAIFSRQAINPWTGCAFGPLCRWVVILPHHQMIWNRKISFEAGSPASKANNSGKLIGMSGIRPCGVGFSSCKSTVLASALVEPKGR
jgi:hypothetical protein